MIRRRYAIMLLSSLSGSAALLVPANAQETPPTESKPAAVQDAPTAQGAPAATQDAATVQEPPAAAAPPLECEIHVWPAERFTARTSGLFSGLGVIGAVADSSGHASGDQGRRAALASALDSEGQAGALGSLDLSKLLNIQPSRIVLHNEPLDRKTVNKIETRRSDSASSCYSELIVTDLFYQKAAIYGRSLRTLFMLRRFGAKKDAPTIYKGWGGNGLKLFPPKEGEDVQAANQELVTVFKADFEEFARNAAKAPAS